MQFGSTTMNPNYDLVTIQNNILQIKEMLQQLILYPRRDLAKWAKITKQTSNVKIGYLGQYLASLVSGIEGTRTGARGHDLRDHSEVKSCSRIDQLDKCKDCNAAVARMESKCPECLSSNIERKRDSKWLFTVRSENELMTLLNEVPRILFILSDYPNYDEKDWNTLQFQVFEIWPQNQRHRNFRTLMKNYYENIYLSHIERNPQKTPAPKNFWPYKFQFYMCNPIRTFHCIVKEALSNPKIDVKEYVEPLTDREGVQPIPMPLSKLNEEEKLTIRNIIGRDAYELAEQRGLTMEQRFHLQLRDTDHPRPQQELYHRGQR